MPGVGLKTNLASPIQKVFVVILIFYLEFKIAATDRNAC